MGLDQGWIDSEHSQNSSPKHKLNSVACINSADLPKGHNYSYFSVICSAMLAVLVFALPAVKA